MRNGIKNEWSAFEAVDMVSLLCILPSFSYWGDDGNTTVWTIYKHTGGGRAAVQSVIRLCVFVWATHCVWVCPCMCVCVYFQDRLPLRDLIRHLVFKCGCWCILQWFSPARGNRPVCMCARKEMNSSNYTHPYYNHKNILFIRSLFYLLSPFFSSSQALKLSISPSSSLCLLHSFTPPLHFSLVVSIWQMASKWRML